MVGVDRIRTLTARYNGRCNVKSILSLVSFISLNSQYIYGILKNLIIHYISETIRNGKPRVTLPPRFYNVTFIFCMEIVFVKFHRRC